MHNDGIIFKKLEHMPCFAVLQLIENHCNPLFMVFVYIFRHAPCKRPCVTKSIGDIAFHCNTHDTEAGYLCKISVMADIVTYCFANFVIADLK